MAYIVKAQTPNGKVRYAGPSGSGPQKEKDNAQVFFQREEAEVVRRKIQRVVPAGVTVSVEQV